MIAVALLKAVRLLFVYNIYEKNLLLIQPKLLFKACA
jgi:hypothetical protein